MNMEEHINFCSCHTLTNGKVHCTIGFIAERHGSPDRDMPKSSCLDNMDLGGERGITNRTIANAIQMKYTFEGEEYYLKTWIELLVTVNFFYEVSRSICACEGAIVDRECHLKCVRGSDEFPIFILALAAHAWRLCPVLNKIDLPEQSEPLLMRWFLIYSV